jgi:hypothetical protein
MFEKMFEKRLDEHTAAENRLAEHTDRLEKRLDEMEKGNVERTWNYYFVP